MLREAMYTTIKTLWDKGYNKSEIARMTGHDWKTIHKVVKDIQRGKSVPQKKPHSRLLDPYHEEMLKLMEQGLSAVRIQEILLSQGIQIGYTTVKDYIAQAKKKTQIFIRMHTDAGEEAQVDFGYVGYTQDNQGNRKKTWVFNMRLSYSRLDYYQKVYDQKVETFILCHMKAFHYFGGVPRTIKIDNLKAAILQANFYEPLYQRLYQQCSEYYGFQSLPCRIYQPNDKGKVESGIKYVKINFFAGRQFKDGDDVDRQLIQWMEKANRRVHGTTQKVPEEVFDLEERKYLLSLPLQEFNLAQVGTRKVYHDCHVYIKHNYYSVPYQYVGKEVEIEIENNLVKIYSNQQLIATHVVKMGKGEFSTQLGHYPLYKCQSQTEYQEKYQAKMASIGQHAERLFFMLLENRKQSWSRPIQGILSLTKKYSYDVVDKSCQRALAFGAYEYQMIKNICQNGSYNLPLEP